MTRLRRSLTAALAGSALVAGALAVAAPASGAIGADTPPEAPGSLTTAAVTPGAGPVSVAVVMPLSVPPTTTGLIDADTLTLYTEPGGLLTRQLDAVVDSPVAIGLDPMVVASIRVLGAAAPPSALAFLERLQAASNEVFLLSYADADPALTATANGGAAIEPLGFDFAIDPDDFGPAATPAPTVSGQPEPDPVKTGVATDDTGDEEPPPLPATEDVLAWPATLTSIAWPAEGTVDDDGLAALDGLGYTDVLLAGSNVSDVSTALVDLGDRDIDGVIADDEISAAVRDAAYASNAVAFQEAVARLDTALQEREAENPGRTIVATLDRHWTFGALRVADLLTAIEAASASQLVTLADVLAGPRGGGELVEPDGERPDTVAHLVEASTDELEFLTIAADATSITQPRRLALLGLSAAGWNTDDPTWTTAIEAFLAASRGTLDAVQITEGSDLLLLSDISSLRMQVSNALPVPVTVYLAVRPLRPLLNVKDPAVEVTIEPDSTSTASVPVESITNGDVTVQAQLHSAGGVPVGDARFVKVILQAGWETAGTLIAGTLVVLVFGGGLVRSILRRRREAAAGGPADD
jgi:hypothetical protein